MKNKKILIIIIALILLFPIPMRLKDGGSIKFQAALYSITKYHKLNHETETGYVDGIGVKILGVEIVNTIDKKMETHGYAEEKFSSTEGITTALTLEDEIQNDTIWCGTFQLIWNDMKNDIIKADIEFEPQLKVVENLNKETFKEEDISEEYYYKKLGTPSHELKEEIAKAIKDKFNETSEILDDFNWENKESNDYFLYAMIKKEFEFAKAFEKLENGNFGKYENVEYLGIKEDTTRELQEQVKVLYYNSKDDFAIKLLTKQEDEVILCKNPEGKTFNEIYKNIRQMEKDYEGSKNLKTDELVKIPNIKLKEKTEFTELEDKPFVNYLSDVRIEKAIQTIEFELNKEGGKIKSEAGIMLNASDALEIEKKREFYIDDTFAIFLIEEDKDTPYFAAKINDITKFQ